MGIHGVTTTLARTPPANRTSARNVEILALQKFITAISVAAVLVFVTRDGIARARRVHSVVIDGNEIDVSIDESHHALSVVVERLVLPAGQAAMPRKRRARGPFRNKQSHARVSDRAHDPAGDMRITGKVHPVENIAAVIKFCTQAKGPILFIPSIVRTREYFVRRGGRP